MRVLRGAARTGGAPASLRRRGDEDFSCAAGRCGVGWGLMDRLLLAAADPAFAFALGGAALLGLWLFRTPTLTAARRRTPQRQPHRFITASTPGGGTRRAAGHARMDPGGAGAAALVLAAGGAAWL